MDRTVKAIILTTAGIVSAAVLVLAVAATVWHDEIRCIASVHGVGDNPYLYEMDYTAPYDLDALVEADIDGNRALVEYVLRKVAKGLPVSLPPSEREGTVTVPVEHCTSFQAPTPDGQWIFGRNYDFAKNPVLVLHSHPDGAYASVSACDLGHLGYNLDKVPDSFLHKALCIAAVYAPMDGMNEKGLSTSIMALPRQPARQSNGRHIVGTSILMRLWLDRCATVEEALELLSTVDVRHDVAAGSGYHYMVADASGDCAVVEFDPEDGWKTMVTQKSPGTKTLHVTNHLIARKYHTTEPDPARGNIHSHSWWRYNMVQAYFAGHDDGTLTPAQALECLDLVHWKDLVWDNGTVEDTQYSAVYNLSGLSLSLSPWNRYGTVYEFGI